MNEYVAAAIALMMFGAWLISIPLRLVSFIDTLWAPGFALAAWVAYAGGQQSERGLLVAGCATLWAVRLAPYLLQRTLQDGEDHRYQAMRDKHGAAFVWVSLLTIFGFQGLLMWVISWPLQWAAAQPGAITGVELAVVAVFLVGWSMEAAADMQLKRFKADSANASKVLDTGLWRYSRHPNYFGNCVMWWALYALAALSGGAWTVFSPIIMTVLLLKVSGVALLEKDIGERRPEYARYKQRTSAFVPWPPKAEPISDA